MDTAIPDFSNPKNKKGFKNRRLENDYMEVQMPKMSMGGRVRNFFSSLFQSMRKMSRQNENRNVGEENSNLEASRGRHDIRGNIEAFTKRVWDASQKLQTMDELLRKQSLRARKNEEIQRREEAVSKRNLLLAKLTESEEYEIIVEFFKRIENNAYFNLRFPESRKDQVSMDYFVGFQNGSLYVIENFRSMFAEAIRSLQKQHAILSNKKRG